MLAPGLDSGELPSLFERYLLDVEDADEAAIETRLTEVKRFWDKKAEHPRYGPTIRHLAEKHNEAKLTLGDARERARLAEEVRGHQKEAEEASARAVEEWDGLLEQAVHVAGGLEPAQRARLERLAESTGIAGPEVRAKLDAAPAAPEPEVLDAGQRETISRALANLARDVGRPRAGLSLFHALDLELTDDIGAVEARHAEYAQENRLRGYGNAKANWESVLSLAKLHLIEGDPRAYVQGLKLDVCKALELQAIKAVTDDDEIDQEEAELLRREAMSLGLTPELAEEVVAELAREHGAGLRTGAVVDFVTCSSCNHLHPRDAGHRRCRECGAPLFVECPDGCGQTSEATAARCTGCGADLHRHATATRTLARLTELIGEGRVGQAREDLDEAIRVLGRSNADVEPAAREVTAAAEAAKRAWAEVDAAIADRRHYSARGLLGDLEKRAGDFPGPAGELPSQALDATRKRIAEAEALLDRVRTLEGEERERGLIEVLQLVADCTEAERELDKLPPQPPGRVEASASGRAMKVRWEASPTSAVRYMVTRSSEDAAAKGTVGETEELQLEDAKARAGARVSYSVEAVRGRARSAPRTSDPVSAAYEVGDMRVAPGDGEVRLSWSPHDQAGRVVVFRRSEGEEREITPDAAGLTDRDVVNGRRYAYTVRVEYPDGGGTVRTEGRTVFAQPVEPPKPLRDLVARETPAGVELCFEPALSGTVSVLRCDEDPELAPGAQLDPAGLSALGRPLAVTGSSALDPEPPSGRCFYLAVTVAGELAVAGAAVRHVALPEVSNVRAVANGRRAQVTWSWPEGIALARIVWRHDRQPTGPEDGDAEGVDYRLGEYRDNGGFSIEMGADRSLFVAVFPAIRVGGDLAYGSGGGKGSRARLRAESKTELRYAVRRTGRLRKRLEVEVAEPGEGPLPQLVLVGRSGEILPRNAGDGEVLARLGGEGPRSSTLELRDVARPLAVRLFLDSTSAAGSFVVFDPMSDDLLIE